ncbi:hypothetical protein E2C01_000149 [Portunus trituberculatus]|uniref:Uncharacterized protein n=1 Tax=Portunus trituberculatus TaxID=210409 RepID=A0A5B7CGI9_PORTR|nr:hypothetical protein [Portunus trituberculatus]
MQLAVEQDRPRCSARNCAPARHTAGRSLRRREGCKTRGFVYKSFSAGPSFTPQHTTGETQNPQLTRLCGA